MLYFVMACRALDTLICQALDRLYGPPQAESEPDLRFVEPTPAPRRKRVDAACEPGPARLLT